MKCKFVITKLTLSGPRLGKKIKQKIINEMKDRVYNDKDKNSLVYYLQQELEHKGILINDIKLKRVG